MTKINIADEFDQDGAICFEVPGPYGVKGSTMAFMDRSGTIRTKTDSKYGRTFTKSVQWAARQAGVQMIPKGSSVTVSAVFGFPRPKGCKRLEPCVRPDIDKLARSLLDALTGIAYADDGQVTDFSARKIYAPRFAAMVLVMPERS